MVAGSSEVRVRRTLVHRMRTPVAVGELTAAVGALHSAHEHATGAATGGADWATVETRDDEVLIITVLSDEIEGGGDPELPLALAMATLTQVSAAAGQDDRPDMRAGNLDLAVANLTRLVKMLGGPS